MTGGAQWEVVGGKSKKVKGKNGVPKPPKEKKVKETPTFEASGPICESQTMFSAFQEKKEIPKPKVNVTETPKEKEKHGQAKKRKDKKPSVPSSKLHLEELISSVTEDDIQNILACMENLCPEPGFRWLKDLSSFFNVKLDVAVEDPTFGTKPIGYPSSLLNKRVYDLIIKTFNRCKAETLEMFFEYCMQSMVQDTLKGIHTLGYRIILQCLAQEKPSIVTTKLAKCIELFDSHQNRQNICLSVFWAAGQAGNKSLEAGVRVWMDLMFRSLGFKTCTNYVIDYLENLLSSEKLKCSKSILTVHDLFPILDAVYSKDLGKNIQKRLLAMYPTLKALSYGPKPEEVVHNFFPSYLRRLEPDCSEAMKKELVSSLVYCLGKDIRSYRVWRHIYIKHFVQSKLLIAHINEEWETLQSKCNKKWLLETLLVFQVTNEEQLNSGKRNPVVEECMFVTKELISKANKHLFSWVRLTLLLILILSSAVSYDIWIHNSFIESNTGKFMKDSGLLVIFSQAGEKIVYYYGKVYKFLEVYVPIASKWTRETVGPYFQSFWKQLSRLLILLWKKSLGIRTWCTGHIHSILIMADEYFPVYSVKVITVLNSLVIALSSQLKIAFVYMWQYSNAAIVWLQSNDYVAQSMDLVQKYTVAIASTFQEHAVSLFHFLKSHIPLFA